MIRALQIQKVLFLYKVVRGAAGASFGLNVAMMAGLPDAVVAKAAVIAKRCKQKGELNRPSRHACPYELGVNVAAGFELVSDNSKLDNNRGALEVLKKVLLLPGLPSVDDCRSLQKTVHQLGFFVSDA
jgi:DNA mismatch repair ATPase MutS